MRIASSLVAFLFLGVATAGVVPNIAGRYPVAAGGNGGHSASVSGVHPRPSGSPTGASLHSIPSSIHSQSPVSLMADANPTVVHSIHPISRRADQSVSPPTASDHPITPVSPRGQLTAVPSHHSGSPSGTSDHHTPSAGSYAYVAVPSNVVGSHKPNSPSGASGHPTPSASSHSAMPSDVVVSFKHSSPSDVSIHPTSTTTHA